MISFAKFKNFFLNNSTKVKYFMLSFAFFSLISPFTGFLSLHSNLISYLNENFYTLGEYPQNISPIFLILESIMFEVNLLIQNILP